MAPDGPQFSDAELEVSIASALEGDEGSYDNAWIILIGSKGNLKRAENLSVAFAAFDEERALHHICELVEVYGLDPSKRSIEIIQANGGC